MYLSEKQEEVAGRMGKDRVLRGSSTRPPRGDAKATVFPPQYTAVTLHRISKSLHF